MALILDLETAPIDDVTTYLEPVAAPSNYKDQEKIASYIKEKTQERAESAGLDPDLCRIVCLGYMREDLHREPFVHICRDEHEERRALTELWNHIVEGVDIISFNGFRFDLPVIMRRSLYLNIPYRVLNMDRYRSNHIDLWQKLSFNGQIAAHSLSFYAQRFGFGGDLDITGADVARLIREGNYEAVAAHCRQDVWWTARLAQRLGYWDGVVDPQAKLAEAVGF